MKKIHKILLAISLGLFVIPEILWSPVGNLIFEFFQSGNTYPYRDNFLFDSTNINILSTTLFIQLFGIFLTFLLLLFFHKKIKNKFVLWASVILSFLLSLITFFCFGLSISLRHIGF